MDVILQIKEVLSLECEGISQCIKRLETPEEQTEIEKAIQTLLQTLNQGGRIILMGVGKSGKVAQKIAATCSSTGSPSLYIHPTEVLHGDLGFIHSKDCVWAISYSGNTKELLEVIPHILALNVPIIGMGGNRQSQLGKYASSWINASVSREACPHNLAPTSSTTLALALGDAIAMALMQQRNFSPANFAKYHPGGALGNRLTMHVKDIMHKEKSLSSVTPNSTIEEVIAEATEKKLGGVLVIEQRKLYGIITDGDIRRSLKLKNKFFELKAKDIMSANPITISENSLSVEALRLMENRESQISVLPVVDQNDAPVGIIRIHDLFQNL